MEKMAAANQLIAPLATSKTVFYLDLARKLTPDGDNWKGLSRDKLHLTAEGDEMWAAELESLLPAVLKEVGFKRCRTLIMGNGSLSRM